MNKSVLWIIIVVILLVVLGVIFLGGSNKEGDNVAPTSTTPGDNQNSSTSSPQSSLENLPPATGNVSDIAAAIISEASGISSLPDQTDPSLTQIGNEVDNFDQSSDVQF
ncbi:MAG: hypothetical protein WCX12_00330 [Candidatus Paceibacterota bacterium]|jgi:flagellar basal body-associated protein FliL